MFYPAELTAPHPPHTHSHTHTVLRHRPPPMNSQGEVPSSLLMTHTGRREEAPEPPVQPAQHLLSCAHTFVFQDLFIGHTIPAEQILRSANENTKAYGD